MKVFEVPLTFAEHHIVTLGPNIRCAFTRPLTDITTAVYRGCYARNKTNKTEKGFMVKLLL